MTYYMIFNNATRELQIIREKNNKQQSTDKFNNKEKTQKKQKNWKNTFTNLVLQILKKKQRKDRFNKLALQIML